MRRLLLIDFSSISPSWAQLSCLPPINRSSVDDPSPNINLLLMTAPTVYPLTSLPPQLLATLKEGTERRLQNIIGANTTSRYASSSSNLADFRLAITDKDAKQDASVLSDFRRLVPLTRYEAYRPWMDKLFERPCKLSEVENLFAPGLPRYLCVSSATSSNKPKYFPRYIVSNKSISGIGNNSTNKMAGLYTVCYKDVVDVTTDSAEVVQKIPVCIGSAGFKREAHGWSVETDSTRMASMGDDPFEQVDADHGH